eukprot:ANDGO_05538.mRNA.1 hypothetical protein SDRG_07808
MHLRLMAQYNVWATNKLLESCDALPETARRAHGGLFFASIHGTLVHILFSEALWYARMTATNPFSNDSVRKFRFAAVRLNKETTHSTIAGGDRDGDDGGCEDGLVDIQHALSAFWSADRGSWGNAVSDYDDLKDELRKMSQLWVRLVEEYDESDVLLSFRYRNTKGLQMEKIRWHILAHVFNHSTHHRGQVSTALTQHGADAPEMDLLYYPGLALATGTE